MSKRPHTKYDKSDAEIEEMVNRQLSASLPNTDIELEEILELLAKRERRLSKANFNHGETWHIAYAKKAILDLIYELRTEASKHYKGGEDE